MRCLAVVMIIPLLLGGCLADVVALTGGLGRDTSRNPWQDRRNDAYRSDWRAGAKKSGTCFASNDPYACFTEWKELSDEEFCKRYSFANRIVARELERRKLDCSKLGVSASSK